MLDCPEVLTALSSPRHSDDHASCGVRKSHAWSKEHRIPERVVISLIIHVVLAKSASPVGKMKWILCSHWLLERARSALLALVSQEKSSLFDIINLLMSKREVKMAGYTVKDLINAQGDYWIFLAPSGGVTTYEAFKRERCLYP